MKSERISFIFNRNVFPFMFVIQSNRTDTWICTMYILYKNSRRKKVKRMYITLHCTISYFLSIFSVSLALSLWHAFCFANFHTLQSSAFYKYDISAQRYTHIKRFRVNHAIFLLRSFELQPKQSTHYTRRN